MKTLFLGKVMNYLQGSNTGKSLVQLVISEWTWNQELLSNFKCRESDSWQLPQECGSKCQETDKTFFK